MDLNLLGKKLNDSGILGAIKSVCTDRTECYLVGGAIRDCLSGRQLNDFDFCFPDNPTEYARKIAEQLGATFFVLDKERGHSRFVLKKDDERLTCDFAPFRAPSLESDLHKRDFTVNAMAIACSHGDLSLIDPLHGKDDLAAGRLRACSEYSFQDDPLRCLKGIRHAVSMDLDFDSETMRSLVNAVPQIDQVASERIRSELSRAIGSNQPIKAFELLGLTGLHEELFGSSSPESFAAALVMLRDLDTILKALRTGACGQVVADYLSDQCEEDVSIEVALRMAAFYCGYRPVALKSVLSALRFSKRTINLVVQLLSLTADSVSSYGQVADKPRSRARWLAETGQEPMASAIFLPLVSQGTMQENLLQTELLLDSYCSCLVQGNLEELVDGNWISAELGVTGPDIGKLQSLLHQAEISGAATTADEARQWLVDNQNSIDNDFGKPL